MWVRPPPSAPLPERTNGRLRSSGLTIIRKITGHSPDSSEPFVRYDEPSEGNQNASCGRWPSSSLRAPHEMALCRLRMFDSRRQLRHGLVSRRRVRKEADQIQETQTPSTVAVQTEQPATQSAPTNNPAYVGLGFATREQFLAWRASVIIRQLAEGMQ